MVFALMFSNLVNYPVESLVIVSCVLSCAYILTNEFIRYTARVKGFKGPPGLLMIGNLEQIQENAAEQYRQWSGEYGPVYQIQLGNIPIIVVNTAASAKTLFSQNSQALSSRPEFYTFHKVVSNTAGTTIGTSPYSESLKRRRKGAATALNKPSVQSYVGHLDVETKDFVVELLKYGHAGNTAIDPMPMIQRLSLSLSLTLNWGVRMVSQEEELFKEITHVEDEISRFRSTTGNLQDYIPLLRLNPFNFGSKKAAEMRDRRDKYLKHLNAGLEERMARNEHQPCIQANIMLDKEAKLNNEELTSISLTMLSGGLDTLTTLVAWSIALFAQRPDIQDKAADAIKEYYSQDQPLCDALDDQKCGYIVALGKECLRYFTVLRLALPRTSIKDITYEGKVIPKGTVFFLNAWACNMDPYVWTDPEVFRPERWIEKPEAPLFTYGLGYRMCAGSLLANREIYLIFIRMLNSFRIISDEKINTHPIHGNSDPTSLVAIPKKYKVKFVPKNKTALDESLSSFPSK
ncbi:putative 3-hydroxyphenylacetate 6-hydroxylase [Microsporum canis]|uniref:3-hydroxyphenylacetate 6 hydroxylase n=1 Tax=Arthroderma otae (strain ATCC MYA-4605 / CBS 113480) TaxID=554155 RepID=C5FFD2_ARTOC|nr:3-hydroxyphenylacetate 6 hydroxylase [Microsporum canis CBS 113480]EEQ28516.1 3-hydroxyphenylacetate 6 hydroxylase [Microsporum canis CBS 113480]